MSNPAGRNPLTDFSQEQLEVMQLVANGHSLKSAAYELGIAQDTIHGRVVRARKIANASSITHLVIIAMREGKIT